MFIMQRFWKSINYFAARLITKNQWQESKDIVSMTSSVLTLMLTSTDRLSPLRSFLAPGRCDPTHWNRDVPENRTRSAPHGDAYLKVARIHRSELGKTNLYILLLMSLCSTRGSCAFPSRMLCVVRHSLGEFQAAGQKLQWRDSSLFLPSRDGFRSAHI